MSDQDNYWNRFSQGRVTRRRALVATSGAAAAAAFLAACGGSSSSGGNKSSEKPAATDSSRTGKLDAATAGKRGGKLIWQGYGDPGAGLELVKVRNAGVHQLASFTHDALLEFVSGIQGYDGMDFGVQPNAAQALPEISPDKLTFTFKLRPAKFHNGRAMDSSDVKYSIDRFATGSDSAFKVDWPWFDKSEAPDASTFVLHAKYPYADALQSLAQRSTYVILCKEHEESADHEKKLLGSGPYTFVSYDPPVSSAYKRNPDYHRQPFPFFDEIQRLGTSDEEKKIADFTSKQTHVTYWFAPESRDRVKKARPDALAWSYPAAGSNTFYLRTDKPPFNDKRVRQALSMSIDRKALTGAVNSGEGEPDQALSWTGQYWQFRHVADLGAAAKYWNFDVAEAKKLFSAAGINLPMKFDLPHWDPTVIGQKFVDAVNLIEAQWKQNGIADANDLNQTFGQYAQGGLIGNYDPIAWGPNTTATTPALGNDIRVKYFSPPEGIKAAPTLNLGWVNDQKLSGLAEKQAQTFDKNDRIAVFRQMEDILAEEMYHVVSVSSTLTYFGDPSLKNAQMPREAYNGATPYMKYWWFDKT